MRVLAIETSCDETAAAVYDSEAGLLSSVVHSQVADHQAFGGVFPNVAKREHERKLIPIVLKALAESNTPLSSTPQQPELSTISPLFSKNQTLWEEFRVTKELHVAPAEITHLAVTAGPGLAPALWTGVTLAKALQTMWNIPLYPVNHLYGHLTSVLLDKNVSHISFPALGIIASGGHTELVHLDNWQEYHLIGQTRDDAIGEAYDKTARLFDIPYPGGKTLADRAHDLRNHAPAKAAVATDTYPLPSPMLTNDTLDMSFAGLKTAVRYTLRDNSELKNDPSAQDQLFVAFENAVAKVLTFKCKAAFLQNHYASILFVGGVAANAYLRKQLETTAGELATTFYAAPTAYTGDNAAMIALAASLQQPKVSRDLSADASWQL